MAEITIVRGDTLRLMVSDIKMSDGTDYVLSDTDVVFLDVKKLKYYIKEECNNEHQNCYNH